MICTECVQTKDSASIDSCNHKFCFKCIEAWSKIHNVCPVCRQKFNQIKTEAKSTVNSKETKGGQVHAVEDVDQNESQEDLDFAGILPLLLTLMPHIALTMRMTQDRMTLAYDPISAVDNEFSAVVVEFMELVRFQNREVLQPR